MERIHITDSETIITTGRNYQQKQDAFKPFGLWYAINNEWLEWCEYEMPNWIKKYQFKLEVDLSKILVISNIFELQLFYDEYKNDNAILGGIHWHKVAEKYCGIEMINYGILKYDNKLEYDTWLYGWDVSSGCIWDMKALIGFNKEEVHEKWFKNCAEAN